MFVEDVCQATTRAALYHPEAHSLWKPDQRSFDVAQYITHKLIAMVIWSALKIVVVRGNYAELASRTCVFVWCLTPEYGLQAANECGLRTEEPCVPVRPDSQGKCPPPKKNIGPSPPHVNTHKASHTHTHTHTLSRLQCTYIQYRTRRYTCSKSNHALSNGRADTHPPPHTRPPRYFCMNIRILRAFNTHALIFTR
jgi:hypothetical protein